MSISFKTCRMVSIACFMINLISSILPADDLSEPAYYYNCSDENTQCSWAYCHPGYLRCNDCGCCDSFSIQPRIDFLWWRAYGNGLELGAETTFTEFDRSSNHIQTKSVIKNPHTKYDPGFRLGLFANCCDSCWDVALNWTHYNTKANVCGTSKYLIEDAIFNPNFDNFWFQPLEDVPFSVNKGKWKFELDMLDLEFGYAFFTGSCFKARPYIGLRGGNFYQSYHVFGDFDFNELEYFFNYDAAMKADNRILAIGPRAGLGLEWNLCRDICVFADGAISGLYGMNRQQTHSNQHIEISVGDRSSAYDFSFLSKRHTNNNFKYISDLSIGVRWERCLEMCGRCHPFALSFAWEHHAFYSFINFIQPFLELNDENREDHRSEKNIYTQGLTVSLQMGF